jgi:hypothetical protein
LRFLFELFDDVVDRDLRSFIGIFEAEVHARLTADFRVVVFDDAIAKLFQVRQIGVEVFVLLEKFLELSRTRVDSRHELGTERLDPWNHRVDETLEIVDRPPFGDERQRRASWEDRAHSTHLEDARLAVGQKLRKARPQAEPRSGVTGGQHREEHRHDDDERPAHLVRAEASEQRIEHGQDFGGGALRLAGSMALSTAT